MRKIVESFACSRNIKTLSRLKKRTYPINFTSFPPQILQQYSSLTYRPKHSISNQSQVQAQSKLIVPYKGYLKIRNSQNMQLSFDSNNQLINLLIPKASTIDDARLLIQQKLSATNAYFVCQQAKIISGLTPFQALLDRNVFLILNNDFSVRVEGELLRTAVRSDELEKFRNLELPLTTRREIQAYCKRVNTWIESKYGAGFENSSIKIPKSQAKKILIQALVDPLESNKRLLQKQQQFQKLYWQIQALLDKKSQAVLICSKMVRARMSLGIFLILGNVIFIWAGTYIYYSWDIIEPIAYFIASLAGIVLATRFFKIKRPFSLFNYKEYMLKKYMEKATKKVGLDLAELQMKKIQLAELEAQMKDYFLRRL